MLFPADLATADLGALEVAAPAVHREAYRKTVAAGNRATVTRTDSLGREAATTYDSWLRPTATTNALGEHGERSLSNAGRVLAETSAHGGQYRYGWDAAGRCGPPTTPTAAWPP